MTDQAITTLTPHLGTRAACRAVGAAQASYYRRHRISPALARPAGCRTGTGASPGPCPPQSGR